jgi:hypothetical protein
MLGNKLRTWGGVFRCVVDIGDSAIYWLYSANN